MGNLRFLVHRRRVHPTDPGGVASRHWVSSRVHRHWTRPKGDSISFMSQTTWLRCVPQRIQQHGGRWSHRVCLPPSWYFVPACDRRKEIGNQIMNQGSAYLSNEVRQSLPVIPGGTLNPLILRRFCIVDLDVCRLCKLNRRKQAYTVPAG